MDERLRIHLKHEWALKVQLFSLQNTLSSTQIQPQGWLANAGQNELKIMFED